jgi:RHS repeat-associated protein
VQTGGRMTSYSYDPSGRLATATDPLGRTDSLFYDPADRLTRHVLPGGRAVLFAYDSSGNLTSLTPPSRPAHAFSFTALDQDSVYSPPSLGAGTWATEYRYNPDRQLTQVIRPDGVTIGFGYEPTTGRPSTVTFDRGTVGLSYGSTTGQLTGLTGPAGVSLAFTYDGMLPKTVTWAGPVTGTVGVSYNSDFRVTSQTVNGANAASFGYDRDGLLTSAGALGMKRHAQHGLLERDSVGSVLGVWSYDPKGALAGYTATIASAPLFQTSYVRDSLGRITELTEVVQGVTTVAAFSYDSAGRLETVRRDGTLTASYHYDANGNRLDLTTPNGVVSGSYDDQDRLTAYGTATYSYTANGELRTKTDGAATTTYTYDALGNLTQVALPDGTSIEYVIDPQNRRIGKRVNSALVQRFLWQGQLAPVAELDGTGTLVSRFVYGTRVNVPDYLVKGGQTYRLILDHLGSVRLAVNVVDGTVAQRLDYDEYGRVTQNTAPGFQPFGYAGGLLDDQTGLVRFGARDYEPTSGRWTAKDLIGFSGGYANLYEYVDNDPVNFLDATGLQGIGINWGGTVGFGGGSWGAGGTASAGVGLFFDPQAGGSVGAYGTVGGAAGANGNWGTIANSPTGATSTVSGFGATVPGFGGFITNAGSADALAGPFDTYIASTPFGEIQFSTDGSIWSLTVAPGRSNLPLGVYSQYVTHTPFATTLRRFGAGEQIGPLCRGRF